MARINTGVPQRSILGPLLFITLINDIFNLAKNATVITYTDDTSIFINGTNSGSVTDSANVTMTDLKSWVDSSCLKTKTLTKQMLCFFGQSTNH